MHRYSVTFSEGQERGIRVECTEHGESEEFQPGFRRVTFHCEACGYEVEVGLHVTHEWRALAEMC